MNGRTGKIPDNLEMFPDEWDRVAFSETISEFRGGAPLRPSDFTKAGVMVLPKGGVGRSGWLHVKEDDIQFCSMAYAESHLSNQVDSSFTIVVLRDLVPSGPSIGQIVQIKDPDIYVLAQGVYGFKVNSRAHPGYLAQLSNSLWYRQKMNSIMVGSTQVHVTNTAFKQIIIPLPPINEQCKIFEALSDTDALIAALQSCVNKKRGIKDGVIQGLLSGEKRLNGFQEAWQLVTLDSMAEIRGGGTPSTVQPQFWDGGIAWCTPTDITALDGKKYLSSTLRTISKSGLKSSSAEIIPSNSVIMTSRATIGLCAINREYVTTNQGFKNFVPRNGVDVEFLFYLLSNQTERFIALCGGSTFLEIGKSQLTNFRVRVPSSIIEQKAIAEILSDLDREIEETLIKIEKVWQFKQGLMQSLLVGRVRLL